MTVPDAESRFHVLAVDDSLVDRKLIEMLLKTSSYQGEIPSVFLGVFFLSPSFPAAKFRLIIIRLALVLQ